MLKYFQTPADKAKARKQKARAQILKEVADLIFHWSDDDGWLDAGWARDRLRKMADEIEE